MPITIEEFIQKGILLIIKGIIILLWNACGIKPKEGDVSKLLDEYADLDNARITKYIV